jgi:hypothetical protein
MASQDDFIRTALRVPPELHKKIHENAAASNRTFNAEIVARLQKSFEEAVPAMGDVAKDLVEEFAAKRKISFSEALDAMVFAGSSPNAPAVLYVKAQPGMTLKELRVVMEEARKVAHEDSHIIYEQGKRHA